MTHHGFSAEFPRERSLSAFELEEARLTFLNVFGRAMDDPRAVPVYSNESEQKRKIELDYGVYKATSIHLRECLVADLGGVSKEVSVTPIDEEGYGRGVTTYRLYTDGVVRRVDIPDRKGIPDDMILLEGDSSLDDLGRALSHNASRIIEGIQNANLEKQMGLND